MVIPAQQLDSSGIRTRSALTATKTAISAAAGDAGPVSRAVTVAGALPPEAPAVKGVDISAGVPSISCASGMSLTRLKGGGIKKLTAELCETDAKGPRATAKIWRGRAATDRRVIARWEDGRANTVGTKVP